MECSDRNPDRDRCRRKCVLIIATLCIIIIVPIVVCLVVFMPKFLQKNTSDNPSLDSGTASPGSPGGNLGGNCSIIDKVSYTFYGYPDNDPPGTGIMHDCGRGSAAGGVGTHQNPLTFATAPGEFQTCEVVYSPYLRKYLINEDYCEKCKTDWVSRIWHVDIWLGWNSTRHSTDQLNCELALTPKEQSQTVIRNPNPNLPVDPSPFYDQRRTVACNRNSIYTGLDAKSFCST